MADSIELPETYSEICETHRKELLEAFEPYFIESCMEQYVRGLYEWDWVYSNPVGKEEI